MDGLVGQRVMESFSQRAQHADDPNEPQTTQIKYDCNLDLILFLQPLETFVPPDFK